MRKIVGKYWLRRTARADWHRLEAMKMRAIQGDHNAVASCIAEGFRPADGLRIERAGRLRARWVVVAYR